MLGQYSMLNVHAFNNNFHQKLYLKLDLNLIEAEFLSSVQRILKANLEEGEERGLTKGIKKVPLHYKPEKPLSWFTIWSFNPPIHSMIISIFIMIILIIFAFLISIRVVTLYSWLHSKETPLLKTATQPPAPTSFIKYFSQFPINEIGTNDVHKIF